MAEINIDQMQVHIDEVTELLKIMAHPERMMVLCQLIEGEVAVAQLQQASLLSQSALSQHLALLRKQRLISARKRSQQVFYSLADHRVKRLIASLQRIFLSPK
ncbi:metalloregulator ArsR/SmtB family transcription factor [Vibrio sp. V33_P6A3T137]|uniref:ArsR/SmtB family transcription factor n=1 Tax=Vibrio sp. V33_P6A3T137 TaxID=1938685 RepID=UPI00137284B0|nr:metalloregulator ArsR/SmtB family transcription factor [Vibrio sp. V33_P6A3T137]NAW77456.1 metalloregulator ArsR/SmtB family transcription factor [Vibrio sp. V33_P6A3T137]